MNQIQVQVLCAQMMIKSCPFTVVSIYRVQRVQWSASPSIQTQLIHSHQFAHVPVGQFLATLIFPSSQMQSPATSASQSVQMQAI